MGKKNKKKTVASTKKPVKTPEQIQLEKEAQENKKILKKLLKRVKTAKDKKASKKKAAEVKAEIKKEEAKIAKIEATKLEPVKSEQLKVETPKPVHHAPKEKKLRKPVFTEQQWQKIRGAVMVIVGLFMIGFVSYFLYTRLFRPESLAHFLPADSTVGFVELNIDPDSDQVKKFTSLFAKYPVYQSSNLVKLADLIFPVDYEKDIEPWIGRKIGVVLMKQNQDDNTVKLLLFVENKSSDKTMEFLKNRALANSGDELLNDTYKNYTIYHYKLSQSYYFAFLNNYLVLAGNEDLLKQLLDVQSGQTNKLQDDPTFQKVYNNLPQNQLVFGYANVQKLFDTLLKNPLFQGQKTHDLVVMQPFMKIFSAEGFTVVANETNLTVQSFEAIDRSQLQGATYLTYGDKYEGKLLELAGESPILFAGGHDLYKEINRIGEIFGSGTNISQTLFDGILQAQKDKYFGKDISLESDVYPLLQNEYLVTVENNFEQPVVSVFMNLTDKNLDTVRIEKLASAFIKTRAIFSPEIKEVTLPDGTKGQEIVASAEEITRTDSNYDGYNVTNLQLGSLPWSINYAILDNTLVLSTNPAALNNIIDRKAGKVQTSLRTSDSFTRTVLPVMRTADEIFQIKLGALIPVLGLDQNPDVKPYVEGFNSLTMAKNYFDDGIATTYVIDVL